MIKNIALLFLFHSLNVPADTLSEPVAANTCSIELFSNVFRLESNQVLSSKDIVHNTNCDSFVLNKLSLLIADSTGSVGADLLKRELAKDFNAMTIEITPRKLSLREFNSILRDQLTSDTNLYFLNIKSINGIKTLGLLEGEQVKATCESCNSFGEKNIKIEISSPVQNTSRTLWFSSSLMAKTKVFKAKRSISFQQKHLDVDDFYSEEVFSNNPNNVLTSLQNIHFYKTNKSILQGTIVSNLDLQAVNLVSYGTPVSITLKNQNINLQRTAMPTRSALFGEVIELRNPNNSKIIAGKVVDYNKVVIEL